MNKVIREYVDIVADNADAMLRTLEEIRSLPEIVGVED